MPICHIHTNRKDSDLTDGVEQRIAEFLAEVMNKPAERCSVFITTGVRVSRNGTSDPAVCCVVSAIDRFDSERSPTYTEAFFKMLTKEFSVPQDRCVINYNPIEMHQVGWPAAK